MTKLERQIRMVVGTALVMLGGLKTSFLLAILGLIILATGIYNYCPAYRILKIDGTKENKK